MIEATCLDSRDRLISRARNSYSKTHPVQAHFARLAGEPNKIYLHAEILALLRAGDTPVQTLVVKNLNGSNLAYPCRVCRQAISAYGVRRVICL